MKRDETSRYFLFVLGNKQSLFLFLFWRYCRFNKQPCLVRSACSYFPCEAFLFTLPSMRPYILKTYQIVGFLTLLSSLFWLYQLWEGSKTEEFKSCAWDDCPPALQMKFIKENHWLAPYWKYPEGSKVRIISYCNSVVGTEFECGLKVKK